MSRYYGIPDASVVFLLLFLCFTHSGLGENCILSTDLLPTTFNYSNTDKLKSLMLLDYLVKQPSNLKLDEHCSGLWQLHFISVELSRMEEVAGSKLRENITALKDQMALKDLFENCMLESDCVEFGRTNISTFLDSIPRNIDAMLEKMETSIDFSLCNPIRCQIDSLNTPYPGYSPQQLENRQESKSSVLWRHHWILILIPLLVCLFSVMKFSGRVPFQQSQLQV
ncbi:fms-related tyrosine kinase 3 ligand isoform X2 [Paroedura picta]